MLSIGLVTDLRFVLFFNFKTKGQVSNLCKEDKYTKFISALLIKLLLGPVWECDFNNCVFKNCVFEIITF
jgi:hypothetical protein